MSQHDGYFVDKVILLISRIGCVHECSNTPQCGSTVWNLSWFLGDTVCCIPESSKVAEGRIGINGEVVSGGFSYIRPVSDGDGIQAKPFSGYYGN